MKSRQGFTIVELLVVIVVIVALALLTIFAFGSWRARTARTEMKNELTTVSGALQNYVNFNNSYPAALSNVPYQSDPNVSVTYTLRSDGKSYCLNAASIPLPSEPHWYFDSNSGGVTTTACS